MRELNWNKTVEFLHCKAFKWREPGVSSRQKLEWKEDHGRFEFSTDNIKIFFESGCCQGRPTMCGIQIERHEKKPFSFLVSFREPKKILLHVTFLKFILNWFSITETESYPPEIRSLLCSFRKSFDLSQELCWLQVIWILELTLNFRALPLDPSIFITLDQLSQGSKIEWPKSNFKREIEVQLFDIFINLCRKLVIGFTL